MAQKSLQRSTFLYLRPPLPPDKLPNTIRATAFKCIIL
jgi:hypothetical protein